MEPVADLATTLSHDELLEVTNSSLCTMLSCDSLLSDLPSDIILEEVLSQIAVEHGQAITVNISREDEPALKVINEIYFYGSQFDANNRLESMLPESYCCHTVAITARLKVPQNSTVGNLKKAIARHFEIHQKRTGSKVKISWKYIWRTYDLNFDGIILDNNCSSIDEYGVVNKVTLAFKKKK